MSPGERWHRQDWHRLSIAEKREEQRRRHDEHFVVREFRCTACLVVVDAGTRIGHLRRCRGQAVAASAEANAQDSSEALDAYFTEVGEKGAGWRVDAAVRPGVQQAAGGSMEPGSNGQHTAGADPVMEAAQQAASKRSWAAAWACEQAHAPTAVGLIAAVKGHFGSGVSNRVAAEILRTARKAEGKPREQAKPIVVERISVHATVEPSASETPPSSFVIGAVLELLERMRQLGVESFTVGGREFAVR